LPLTNSIPIRNKLPGWLVDGKISVGQELIDPQNTVSRKLGHSAATRHPAIHVFQTPSDSFVEGLARHMMGTINDAIRDSSLGNVTC
jgi:hypothetical protein